MDSNPTKGIAITGSVETDGIWYYSTDGGSNWITVGTVDASQSLLLADDALTRLYFAPAANYSGTVSSALTMRAWDRTSGTAGAKVNTSSVGGSSAFSSATDVIDVNVTPVNDPPVLVTTGTPLSYTENDAATAIDPSLTVTDIDNTSLTGATVTVSANYANGQDVLAFTNQLGITGSWNAATGVLTLSGTTTVANYQTALRAVTYFNASDDPSPLARTVSFVVNDGTENSTAATRAVTVTAVNDAPTTSAVTLAPIAEDSGARLITQEELLANADDVDGPKPYRNGTDDQLRRRVADRQRRRYLVLHPCPQRRHLGQLQLQHHRWHRHPSPVPPPWTSPRSTMRRQRAR